MGSALQHTYDQLVAKQDGTARAPASAQTAAQPAPDSDIGRITAFSKELMVKLAKVGEDYQHALVAVHLDAVLDPTHAENDRQMQDSRRILGYARNVINRYEARMRAVIEQAGFDIAKLSDDPQTSKELVDGFRRGVASSQAQLDQTWALEKKTIDAIEHVVDVLESTSGRWTVQNNKFMFSSDADLDRYNAGVVALQSVVRETQELKQKAQDRARSKFKQLQE